MSDDNEWEGLESFCSSEFWNLNVTWNTDSFPRPFTPCFEKTVLAWIPCAFLWLTAGFEISRFLKSKVKGIPSSIFNLTRIAIAFALVILEMLHFGYSFRSNRDESFEISHADRYTSLIKGLTFFLAFLLLILNKRKGIHSSGTQFTFWMLTTICYVFEYQSSLRELSYDDYNDHQKFWFILLQISYPLVVIEFLLNFFTDGVQLPVSTNTDEQQQEELTKDGKSSSKIPCPEATASFPSRLTFQWFWNLAWLGYKKPLVFDDLWDLNVEDKSKSVLKHFYKYWKPSLAECQKWNDTHKLSEKYQLSSPGQEKDGKEESSKTKKTKKRLASVLGPLCKANWDIFLFGAALKLLQDLLTFASPQILDLLIEHVSGNREQEWKGYFYAFLLTITAFCQTIFLGQYFARMFVVGMRIRSALIGAIFEKSLIISNAARKESTLGEIVNLMSVDSQRFVDLTTYVNMLWSAPLQISLSLYFLYNTLGVSIFAGVGIMLMLIPINAVITNKAKDLQIRQMKNKDQRVKLMNEILSGMKVLKLMAWEPSFANQIDAIRQKELRVLRVSAYLNATTILLWTIAPFLVSLVTFATYVLIDDDNVLDARKAFVSLSLFNIMRMPMTILPNIIVFMVEAGVSLKRVNRFMNAEEIPPDAVSHDAAKDGHVITMDKGNFSWDDQMTLKNINLNVKQGSLVAVVGSVGSGKSSLLSAILGEMQKRGGSVNTTGSIAYVAQQAWIQNATLRDNILFGNKFDKKVYNKVIDVCALKPDLAILAAGDMTEIGEKGINLSGGQKQRISLARSVYSDSDIYLFDDPLSAVDSHVGKHLFEKMVGPKGILKGKTRVIVTHGITYLPHVDYIIVMNNGSISETGTFNQLLEKKGAFADFLIQHAGAEDLEQADAEIAQKLEEVIGSRTEVLARQLSRVSESGGDNRKMSTTSFASTRSAQSLTAEEKYLSHKASRTEEALKNMKKDLATATAEKLIEVEKAETGSVKRDVYTHYLQSVGWTIVITSMILYIICSGLQLYSNIWLSQWSTEPLVDGVPDTKKRDLYLTVYGALGMAQALSIFLGNAILSIGCLKAAKFLHAQMLNHTLRCPMSWYDATPIGRIVNRFSKDVDVADSTFPANMRSWLSCLFSVLSTLVAISYSSPLFLAVVVPIGIVYFLVQRFYVATSRQLKRLESVSRSPIYSHFSETLTGAVTIRAFQRQQQFKIESERTVDHNQIAYYPSIVANRWLAIRLETVGNLIILFSALFAVIGDSDGGSVGLSVSYALSVTQTLNWLVRMTSDVETNVVAVERIKEYGETVQEAEWEISERKPPKSWPEKGVVEFTNYQTRYREGLDLVLKDVTCKIEGGEKVGIVGRTGAGKSSLTLALFRIVEAVGGSIIVDGQNISKLGLHDVRGRLTIIPQDPVLFSGTLRVNLDPFEKYSDDEIWHALEFAHLKEFVRTLPSGLVHPISEGGENLSVGQRQLICLARALLRKTKVLVLDEATAAVDLETDDLIQETIRTEFKECTVLTIAHRLNTIMDCDRVMVLDQGEIREFDGPQNLLKKEDSIFYSMAKDAGLV